ncbi:type II toxin-antitoxin system VapB family antitoxin [Burkholderia sp. BCC0419]|uniref:type II toxin-antitoxin system VapB family antitoxin n=1 Tax=Burkholderia sp. BCC0419 TaxID=486878 RepID=UPI00158BB2BE|nr:type II toxin-antitoxin system VapB family antitoxin [Burkholderia sp. BCC0419]
MRITITIDDDLYRMALQFAEPGTDDSALLRAALATFVRVRGARRLAALGGTMPDMVDIPRRRQGPASS